MGVADSNVSGPKTHVQRYLIRALEERKLAKPVSQGKGFQAKATASAKVLRQLCAKTAQETAREQVAGAE